MLLLAQTVGFEPTWHCCQIDFESSTSRYSSYISLFRFALKRLFSVLTLVFDILTYFVLYVARGCLGNIRATIVFRATLFGTTQGKLKICTEFEDLAIFQSKSFFFVWRFYREKHKFCCRKWRFYPQNAKGLYALIAARIDYTAVPLTKQWLMNHCTEGERAFNRAWDMLKNNGYLVAHVRPAKHGRFCYEYELRDSNNGWNGVYLIYYDAQGNISSTYWYDHYPQNRTSGNHTCGKRSGGNVGSIIITIIKYS